MRKFYSILSFKCKMECWILHWIYHYMIGGFKHEDIQSKAPTHIRMKSSHYCFMNNVTRNQQQMIEEKPYAATIQNLQTIIRYLWSSISRFVRPPISLLHFVRSELNYKQAAVSDDSDQHPRVLSVNGTFECLPLFLCILFVYPIVPNIHL